MAEALPSPTLTDLGLTYAEAIPQQVPTPVCLGAILEEDPEPSGELEVESPGVDLLPMLHAFDSHFHLDRARRKLRLQKDASMREVEDAIPVTSKEYALSMSGVAVFCDPDTYPSPGEIPELTRDGYLVAIGVHPKHFLTRHKNRHSWIFYRSRKWQDLVRWGLTIPFVPRTCGFARSSSCGACSRAPGPARHSSCTSRD
ncbi:hypothetical protein KP79_PYT03751 [Mizuhopecten yessoensis]|uniref:Uncharacterized protein n=1 Tax=Mizuhopecten yessoensis TaxID=6573 RepID=A0A210QBH2_MIZYE|nr:hypothetical protein KP79_PYT03751 [Mizuhopecten yessoensis]